MKKNYYLQNAISNYRAILDNTLDAIYQEAQIGNIEGVIELSKTLAHYNKLYNNAVIKVGDHK